MTKHDEKIREPSMRVYLAAAAAFMGSVAVGTALGYTSPAIPSMTASGNTTTQDRFVDSEDIVTKSWIGSSMTVGALVGSLISGACSQRFGRRLSLIMYSVPFIAGWLLMYNAGSASMIILGRVITGFCSGLVSGTAPSYATEISTPKIRGMLGTYFQVCITIGIFSTALFGSMLNWRWLSLLCCVPPLLMLVLMIPMPETPVWILQKRLPDEIKQKKASEALCTLRTADSDISDELQELIETIRESETKASDSSSTFPSLSELKTVELRRPLYLAIALMFFQQFSGINTIIYYQESTLRTLDIPGMDVNAIATYGTIISCFTQVLATIAGSCLVDKLGRRTLLLYSGAGHVIALLLFGMYFYVDKLRTFTYLPVFCLAFYLLCFSIGFGPIPWLMIPELTPNRYRSFVASISSCFNWTCAFIVTKSFLTLLNLLKPYGTYWFFTSFCALSLWFVYDQLPETKGKSFEQIRDDITRVKSTHRIVMSDIDATSGKEEV